jgi:hypothetical protein
MTKSFGSFSHGRLKNYCKIWYGTEDVKTKQTKTALFFKFFNFQVRNLSCGHSHSKRTGEEVLPTMIAN